MTLKKLKKKKKERKETHKDKKVGKEKVADELFQ